MPVSSARTYQTLNASATSGPSNILPRRNHLQRVRTASERNDNTTLEEGNNQGNAERDNPVWFSSRHSRFKIFKHWGVEAHEKAKYIGRRVSGAEKALREVVQREERDLIPSSIHHANPQIDPNAHEIPFVGLIQEELGSRRPMQVGPSMRQDDGRPIGVALSVGEVEIPEQDLGGDTLVFESERYIEWVFDSFAAEVVAPRFGWGD